MQASQVSPSGRVGVGGHPLTGEQERIIAHAPTETLKCQAFAGCAKTTTSAEYTHAWPRYRGLYLAFNAAIAGDAKGRFPAHIQTQTAHGHAYTEMGINRFRDRLVAKLRPNDIDGCNDLLRPVSNMTPIALQRAMLKTLNNFLISSDHQLQVKHLAGFPIQARQACLPMATAVIERLMDYETNGLKFTHDIYLKAFSRLRTISDAFDYLIVDEAQDLNPVLIDIVRRAKRPSLVIGDPYQSIYSFRGAENAMDAFDGETFSLSQSFRFGPRIAEVANHILRQSLARPALPLRGFEPQRSAVLKYEGIVKQRCTILARSNFRLFEGLVQIKLPYHVVGGVDDLINQVAAGYALYKGLRPVQQDPLVSRYPNWHVCKEAAEVEEEPELARLVKIVEQYTDAIPEILTGLRARYCPNERDARVIVSTAHKAKGREWDHVIILDDFHTPTQLRAMLSRKKIDARDYTAEINLLYVACTRGKVTLSIAQPLYDEIAGGAGLSDQLFDPM